MASEASSFFRPIPGQESVNTSGSEGSVLLITRHKLTGHNYLQWAKSVMMFISGKGKDDYLTGAAIPPRKDDPNFRTWKSENNMVMSWLINTMENDIGQNFLFYNTAYEIWNAAKETYSDYDNTAELFEIKGALHDLKQGEMTVTQYYNTLSRYWQQLDVFESPDWECPEDASRYKKIIEKERIFKFLLGLDKSLDEVRGRILGSKPLPSIREAFSEVRREESRKKLMMGTQASSNAPEGSALVSRGTNAADSRQRKGRPWCDHCRRPGHTKETCWKIHGKPAEWKPNKEKEARSFVADSKGKESTSESAHFSKEQIEWLQKMFGQASSLTPIISTGSTAQKGKFFTALNAKSEDSSQWIVDSGASDHMTGDASLFHKYRPCHENYKVRIADGSLSTVTSIGEVIISESLVLKSVLLVPNLTCNLLSISKLTRDLNCAAKFSSTYCVFQDLNLGKMISTAKESGGLYRTRADDQSNTKAHCVSLSAINTLESGSILPLESNKESAIMLWHFRLGHPNFTYLSKLFPSLFINKNPKFFQCEICQLSKHCCSSYPLQGYKPSQPFSIIHSDIWGPSRIQNITGARWFVSFVDDHTRLTWVFLMKEKSETESIFRNFHNMIQNQFQTKIQVLRSDNAKEYFNSILGNYFLDNGIIHQSSCVDTPQQNGIAERKNRHLLEVARSLMFTNNVPKQFWGEAVLTATYLINRMPSRTLKFNTPCQVLLKFFPQTRIVTNIPLKVFGCSAYVHISSYQRSKLDPKSIKCLFLGYSSHQKGYKCYCPSTKKTYNTMDVTFFENIPYYPKTHIQGEKPMNQEYQFWDDIPVSLPKIESQPQSQILPELESQPQSEIEPSIPMLTHNSHGEGNKELKVYARRQKDPNPIERPLPTTCQSNFPSSTPTKVVQGNIDSYSSTDDLSLTDDLHIPIAQRKGVRSCTQHPISHFVSYEKLSPSYQAFTTNLDSIQIPSSVQEALQHPKWREAVNEELQALQKNGTWELAQLPQGKQAVGCKWVFNVKYKADGTLDRYKARLVAKGFTQTYGIDYQETFAPVAKLNTIRVLLSLAANLDWSLHQLDIKNAFINGDLEEEVYMEIPPGLKHPNSYNRVCRLRKSLYGLKQSPRAWFDRFTKAIKKQGYSQGQSDHTLFIKRHQDVKITILIVYVDDIIVTGNHEEEISRLKKILSKEFEIKDLGALKYFLGMEIARSRKGIFISQRKYTLDLLKETGMLGCKPSDTPMDSFNKIGSKENQAAIDKGRYQRLVGKLIYLSHTRPDICFAVSVVSQFMNNPTEEHQEAVYRILRYLKMTPGKGLFFKKGSSRNIYIFSDVD